MHAPKLPSFFKILRHRQFDLKTRFYDAQKEDFERRVKNTIDNKANLRFSKHWQHAKRSKETISSNKRIVLIVIILLLISFVILKY